MFDQIQSKLLAQFYEGVGRRAAPADIIIIIASTVQ